MNRIPTFTPLSVGTRREEMKTAVEDFNMIMDIARTLTLRYSNPYPRLTMPRTYLRQMKKVEKTYPSLITGHGFTNAANMVLQYSNETRTRHRTDEPDN